MNREDTRPRLDASPGQAISTPVHDAGLDLDDSKIDSPSSLDLVDATAVSALSSKALARYQAYKEELLARDHDEAAIVSTLTLFVWDLSDSRQ